MHTQRLCQYHAITAHCFLLQFYLYSAIKNQFMITDLFNSRIFYENWQTADNCSKSIIDLIWYSYMNRTIRIHGKRRRKVLWSIKRFIGLWVPKQNIWFNFSHFERWTKCVLKKLVMAKLNCFILGNHKFLFLITINLCISWKNGKFTQESFLVRYDWDSFYVSKK